MSRPDPADIQALVDRGFGSLDSARFLLLRVTRSAAARTWLKSLGVTTVADARAAHVPQVLQIAFTALGLTALGLDPVTIPGFAPEFLDGLAGDPSRSRRLGDIGSNAPTNWRWGTGDKEPHLLLTLLASGDAIEAFERATLAGMAGDAALIIARGTSKGPVGREPFGFADGVSQPEPDWEEAVVPGGASDRLYRNRIALGEFVLGTPNEYGMVADYPLARGLGVNGSYLVYRQLVQDVSLFWKWVAARTREDGEASAVALAETMIGRQIDGSPLARLTHCPIDGATAPANDFSYAADPDGRICPLGAHVRRANPRSSDDPQGRRGFLRDIVSSLGLSGTAMHDAVASSRFHRLLRRGRSYGPTLSPSEAISGSQPGAEAGLHFLAINANFARQFEFIQSAWASSPYFAGLSGEADPILGNRANENGERASDAFSYWDEADNPRLVSGIPQFVKVVGGAYFFVPGIAALRSILGD